MPDSWHDDRKAGGMQADLVSVLIKHVDFNVKSQN